MFMEKSKQAIINGMSRKKSQMHLAGSQSIGDFTTLKKASSCSTIYIDDSTVSQPNLKNTIKCVSLAIYYHIKNRHSDTILDIFDEKKQPLTVSEYKRELITRRYMQLKILSGIPLCLQFIHDNDIALIHIPFIFAFILFPCSARSCSERL